MTTSEEALLGSEKNLCKKIVYMSERQRLNFINVLHTAFTHVDPENAKKTVKSAVSFGAFGTYKHKSCA